MITRDYTPKRKGDIVRFKFIPGTRKKVRGKLVINVLHVKSQHNVKVTVGIGELKELIRLSEKEEKAMLKLRK